MSELKALPAEGVPASFDLEQHGEKPIITMSPLERGRLRLSFAFPGFSLADLADDPDVAAEVQAGVDHINQQFAQVEQIKKFTLIGEEWLPDSDVLTPTSKLKRRGVQARYAHEIETIYADAE